MSNNIRHTAVAIVTLLVASACSTSSTGNHRTSNSVGAEALVEKFVRCDEEVFRHIAQESAALSVYAPTKARAEGGEWFAPTSENPQASTHRTIFQTPMSINGLNAVGAMYAHFKARDAESRDSHYWGFYFADDPQSVIRSFRDNYGRFKQNIRGIGVSPTDLKIVIENETMYHTTGMATEDPKGFAGAKTLLECTIQRKFGSLGKK